MDCREILELLPLYIEGELEKSKENAVKKHLEECKSCAEELRFLENILSEAGKLPEIEPSENFHTSLKEKLKTVKQIKVFSRRKLFKTFTAAATSAAVIAVSITALNTEFYKIDNSALNRNKNEMTESVKENSEAHETEETAAIEKMQKEPEREKVQAEKTQKTEVKKDVSVKSTPSAQSKPQNELKEEKEPDLENKKEEKLEMEENGLQIASQTNENPINETEEIYDEAVIETEEKVFSADDAIAEEKAVSGGGGGGNSGGASARTFKMSPRFDKIVLKVKIPEGDLSIMELIGNYAKENGEYKIPLENFYDVADKIFAVPDCEAYYSNENKTEEYQKLAENDERKKQIEEICSFGYVIIIEN